MVFGYQPTRHPFHQLRDEMDRLLTGFFGPAADGLLPPMFRSQPAANVWEQDDALLVEMEVPGVKSDQVDISVAGGELSIKHQPPRSGPGRRHLSSPRAAGRVAQPRPAAAGRGRRGSGRGRTPRRRAH